MAFNFPLHTHYSVHLLRLICT